MATLYTKRHVGVLIGRFQPFHNGHLGIIEDAITAGITRIKIFVGSANRQRTLKNPFKYKERSFMIMRAMFERFDGDGSLKLVQTDDGMIVTASNSEISITVYPLNDYLYNEEKWATEFMQQVFAGLDNGDKIVLLGHKKDDSTYYLDAFPEFGSYFREQPFTVNDSVMSATDFRNAYFLAISLDAASKALEDYVPKSIAKYLMKFTGTSEYDYLVKEYEYIRKYKKAWANTPYPPIFVTSDAIVQQGNMILLVRRKNAPGKDKWAIPGGFVNVDETILDGMIRELREETGVELPERVLRGSIINTTVIDTPDRSERGRIITHVYHIKLDHKSGRLPKVTGGSDATEARWFRFDEVTAMKSELYEDHGDIIDKVLGI